MNIPQGVFDAVNAVRNIPQIKKIEQAGRELGQGYLSSYEEGQKDFNTRLSQGQNIKQIQTSPYQMGNALGNAPVLGIGAPLALGAVKAVKAVDKLNDTKVPQNIIKTLYHGTDFKDDILKQGFNGVAVAGDTVVFDPQNVIINKTSKAKGFLDGTSLSFTELKNNLLQEFTRHNSPNPQKMTEDLSYVYERSNNVKKEIDSLADTIAGQVNGFVAKTDLKGIRNNSFNLGRVVEKFMSGSVKDIARNSVITNTYDDAKNALSQLLKNKNIVFDPKKNFFEKPTYLGYRGINANYKDVGSGVMGEIQINIPEIIYVKESPEIAKKFMSPQKFSELQNSSLPAGMGHKIYEIVRPYEESAKRRGDMITRKSGRVDYKWTGEEKMIVAPLIKKSNEIYDAALSFVTSNKSF